jgi:hypothetical protein
MKLFTTVALASLVACGPQVGVPADDASSTGTTGSTATTEPSTTVVDTSSTPTSTVTTSPPDPSTPTSLDSTTVDPDSSGSQDSDIDPSLTFIQDPEVACHHCSQCDVWSQDCPRGEKCMPWANDGGNAWNAARCSPIEEDPDQLGDPCTVEGSGVSGIDSCDISAMCWNVDPGTNTGTCVPFCTGSEADPSCAASCDICRITNEGVLILCLPLCDPADAACPDGQVCMALDDSFSCAPVGDTVALGEVCDDATACADGLRCLDASVLPSCAGDSCCAPWCSLDEPDPCPVAMPGTACVPLDFGAVPGCVEPVGYCAIP